MEMTGPFINAAIGTWERFSESSVNLLRDEL